MAGVVASPLPGPSGNVEFFVHLRRATEVDDPFADGRSATLITAAVEPRVEPAGPSS
jgi:23S rRNA (cytidine1920-2'-O)/16S rRNA (cytidine1409-2'-O)-methyltransferase